MMRPQSIQRLWTTRIRPHSSTRIHLTASARCRTDPLLEHSRRWNQYQAYPTRLRGQDQAAIKEYLAVSDTHPAVIGFLSSVAFVRGVTGYNFVDRHLLLQALYGEGGSDNPQQRLAIIGDILLQYVLKDDWFQLGLPASQIGTVAAQVATNANLADVAKEIGLVRHIGALDPRIKERTGEHHLGTIVEALLGAIHEDSGKDIAPVRRAMHQMGLVLPNWFTSRKSEPNQPDLHEAKSETSRPDLHTIRSESDRFSIRKIHPERTPPKREIRRLKSIRKLQNKIDQGLFVNEDSNQGNIGYQFQTVEEQVTSDGDFETLDAARARLEDMDTDEKSSEDYDAEQAVLEDVVVEDAVVEGADSKQTHLGDQDADQTHFETSATHQESIEPTAAEFTSSSWRELTRMSGDSSTKPETALRQKRGKSPATDFDNAIGAFMIESDGSMVERELVGGSEWPVRHGWFPQRCQITLDVALPRKKEVAAPEPEQLQAAPSLEDVASSEKPPTTNEIAFGEPDGLLSASTSDDVAPKESLSKKKAASREPDRLPVASTPDDVALSKKPRTTKKSASREPDRPLAASTSDDVALSKKIHTTEAVAASELDQLLAAPTLDKIALPKLLHASKAVAVNEPHRLLVASTPDDVALSKKIHTTDEVAAYKPDRLLAAPTLDDIALPKLAYTTKAVAAYEPDRLRLIVAPL